MKEKCSYCQRVFDEKVQRTKEHIFPISKGGFDIKENRIYACFDCNHWKDDKTLDEWEKEIKCLIGVKSMIKNYTTNDLIQILESIEPIKIKLDLYFNKVSSYLKTK